jgi:CBS-domain-containing membrane protein
MAFAHSSACNAIILSMKLKSMLRPPNGAEKLASRLEPPEYGTLRCQYMFVLMCVYLLIGILYLLHVLASSETSSVDLG